MKRIAWAMGAAGLALALAPAGIANANGTTTGNSVTINPYADYDFIGTQVHLGLQVRCTAADKSGTLDVTVSQNYPETPYPEAAGSGPQILVCDGLSRSVAVTVAGVGFDAGKAKATATLTTVSPAKTATVSQSITIVVV
jgi:hypothetical protein